MESVIAWALADKLGYWIKSFSREKLRLRGRTAQLSNAEIDGDALHAALGLPPALAIATARIQELVITLPSILNMQVEPTVVNIDRLDIILEEKDEMENHSSPNSNVTSPSSTKDSGHGYADKMADGMTVKKVEWKSLTVDLKPHVNNSADVQLNSSIGQYSAQDDGGAIQMPYVGERVFEGKSGEANITIQRTEQNDLLGLEFQVHIIEALSPALSEHGLLTLVSFITSLCVVLSRRAADPGQKDVECCKLKFAAKISGVRLGGGMRYTEYVLQRLGIMPDGCPGKILLEGIINSFSRPLAKLLKLYTVTDKDDVSSKEGEESEFGMGMPYGVDVSVELRDWIFALEGTEEIGDWACRRTCNRIPREVKFWQAAIRNLHLRGKHSGRTKPNSAEKASQKTEYPYECFTARVEGLQAIRPHLRNPATGNGTAQRHQAGRTLVSSDQGTDIEATMVTSQDGSGVSKWTVDKTRFSVEDLVTGAVLTKEEQEYLSTLCRSEADSLGRIAAAVLLLLELDGSLGQAAIDQLASLGSELAGIFTPEKLSTK
ncbi:hypothetical protein ACQ4PT_056188 [Festuca glaucescens]